MIQRIQTVFLFLVSALLVAACFFPVWAFDAAGGEVHQLFLLGYNHISASGEIVKEAMPYAALGMLAFAAATISLISIFQFKNRMKQLKLGYINAFLMIGIMAGSLYLVKYNLVELAGGKGNYSVGFFLVVGAIVANMVAGKFIRKDEELVRSMDRMR
ncbi:DUF4293 domain-containing protein [Persicobacter psychrovividus]|uniref:Membrane protein n=1 Tax=Persicobacter psychrovividus TaxID=387638 RepID=A0ABN6L949_9BACT|nr:membrane protein [Persicobacter psychrovividus]